MARDQMFVNAAQVVTCAGPGRARRGDEMRDAGVLTDAAVLVRGESIAEVGPAADLAAKYPDA
jgi:imidazolonepropionase